MHLNGFSVLVKRLMLSQANISNHFGVRLDTVKKWESGKTDVPIGVMNELRKLCITADEFGFLFAERIAEYCRVHNTREYKMFVLPDALLSEESSRSLERTMKEVFNIPGRGFLFHLAGSVQTHINPSDFYIVFGVWTKPELFEQNRLENFKIVSEEFEYIHFWNQLFKSRR